MRATAWSSMVLSVVDTSFLSRSMISFLTESDLTNASRTGLIRRTIAVTSIRKDYTVSLFSHGNLGNCGPPGFLSGRPG